MRSLKGGHMIWRNMNKNRGLLNEAAKSRAFIVFDTETTGLGADAEIVELAACKCLFSQGEFKPYDTLHLYIRPCRPMTEDVVKIHGITNEFLAEKQAEKDLFPVIKEFFGPDPVLGAYNSAFDVRMMDALYRRCGEVFTVKTEVDLLKIAKDVFCEVKLPNHKLGTIANAYGVDEGIQFHNALDDVTVLIRVINKLVQDLKGPEQHPQIRPVVYKLNFYPGYRGNSRVYVSTSAGVLYYAFKEDRWAHNDGKTDLSKLDMAHVEKQVFGMAGVYDYKELLKTLKEGGV